ncbi:hypothetical protein DPMN_068291 [Dreissena polymorpha]|uniref:Uncharacterized protein n=1 Tax=Dreissena polymorpha TaxID=45954 RepID=A0A9D3YYY4_DREPO|nr:hypothetical protein DPMN_068291 [Dreissena polymorpha]
MEDSGRQFDGVHVDNTDDVSSDGDEITKRLLNPLYENFYENTRQLTANLSALPAGESPPPH